MKTKFVSLLVSMLSFSGMIRLSNFLFSVALKVRGYNNFENYECSGEAYFVKNILSPMCPKVCVDVGANVGSYTLLLLNNTSSHVYCFEPLSSAYVLLRHNLKAYEDRVNMINKGVADKNKVVNIHFSEDAASHASLSEEVKEVSYVNNECTELVEVVTLDSCFCDDGVVDVIDFIKIDTEGFEVEVLKGALSTIDKYKPEFIQIEYNWHQLFKGQSLYAISRLLPSYDVYQLLPNGWAKRDPKDPFSNIYLFSNFVFVRHK